MANEGDMGTWTELLHSSTKLLEHAAPSAQFPPIHRNLDQLETISKKLKAKTHRAETPTQSIAATRLLAREGINAEQLAHDLKSFELKTTYEDVFPSEATTVEEYIQQVHEMAMVSSIQEAQKDNLRSFNDYMMQVMEDDWNKEKRDFLQSLSRLSSLPRSNSSLISGISRMGQVSSPVSSSQISFGPTSMDIVTNKPIAEKKSSVYAEVVKNLNDARCRGLPFNPASAFRCAYESLNLDAFGGKAVSIQKIWHLIQMLVGEGSTSQRIFSRKMSLVIGARRHLEWGHEKYLMDTIHSHPTQAALGGTVGNLQKVWAFLRVRLRDHGVLDFDANDARRQPPIDTTWQQIYFCLRTGYYDEARNVAQTSRVSHQFAPQLTEWITTGGLVSPETAASASEECEKLLRIGDRAGRPGYDRKKLLLYAMISGSKHQIDRLLRDLPTLFNTIEDFLWFKLCAVRDCPTDTSSVVLSDGLVPYSLDDLQNYLNKFEPSYYTKNGKDPLVYPYVLLLSIQLLPAVQYLSKEMGEEGYNIDAVHISISLADHNVVSEGAGNRNKLGTMDACAEVANIIHQYGSMYLRHNNLALALNYYVQAAAAMGGGELSWVGRSNADQQRQRSLMLKQLLMEILLREGGILLLLGPRGIEDGELRKYLMDWNSQHQFLLEAAHQCQEAGFYEKSVEIHKRVGAFSMALETINKCLSDAICAMSRGKLDGDSRASGLINSGNDLLDTVKYTSEASTKHQCTKKRTRGASQSEAQTKTLRGANQKAFYSRGLCLRRLRCRKLKKRTPQSLNLVRLKPFSLQERELVSEHQVVLRQLEAILMIHKLAREGKHVDALREITKLSFLPLNPRGSDVTTDIFKNLSPHVQACVPDLLKVALSCADNVADSDGTLRVLKSKIANFVANNMTRSWPHDLYERVARSL